MIRKVLYAAFLVASLSSTWGKATTKLTLVGEPSTVFTVGPGTIVSIRRMDLPFSEPYFAVKYQTDDGKLIEVWTPRNRVMMVEGLHGELTYSTHPERILNFRLIQRKASK